MPINGEDKSLAYHREQGRQALEPGFETRLPAIPEIKIEDFPRLKLVSNKNVREPTQIGQTFSSFQAKWNVREREQPEYTPSKYTLGEVYKPRQKPSGLTEGFTSVCERWALDDSDMAKLLHLEGELGLSGLILSGQVPPITGDLKDRMALVIGISIGLGELFDDDEDAECQWLNVVRSELGGLSPLRYMLKGDMFNIRHVVDLVDSARGLK